ncbi:hypothetical protein Aduo_008853 [Ancylostoma duodenale]
MLATQSPATLVPYSDVLDAINPLENPVEYADVVSVAGPQEFVVLRLTEPVDVEDLWYLQSGLLLRWNSTTML